MKLQYCMKKLSMVLFVLALCLSSLHAKEKISWLVWELAPEFIAKGELQGQGYADKFLQTFIKNLPEYEHEIVWLNTRRWFRESGKPNRCTPHIWKQFKFHEQFYSKAYTLTPPHGILIHERNRHKFTIQNDSVSIQELLKDDSLTLTVPIFRYKKEGSRYPVLYPYFEPYIDKKNLQEVISNTNEISPVFLDKNRSDYLIAYPTTATAYSRINKKTNQYLFYPIKEDPFYKTIHVACFNNALGQTVIHKINKMIDYKMQETFLQYHEEWNNKNPQFRQKYIDYFIQGIDDSYIIQ